MALLEDAEHKEGGDDEGDARDDREHEPGEAECEKEHTEDDAYHRMLPLMPIHSPSD